LRDNGNGTTLPGTLRPEEVAFMNAVAAAGLPQRTLTPPRIDRGTTLTPDQGGSATKQTAAAAPAAYRNQP
jgi:hypothetical protein